MFHISLDENLQQKIVRAYASDPQYSKQNLPTGVILDRTTNLYYKADKICLPNNKNLQNEIIHEFHDAAGHPDASRTTANLLKSYWWTKGVHRTIKKYVEHCPTCQRIKPKTTTSRAPLQSMPTPTRPWEHMSMDFITNLPEVDGYNAIVTFVDMFTKQAHFAPCSSNVNARQLAKIYLDTVYKHHGIQRLFIGDRDPKYTSEYWRSLMQQLKTKMNLSTAYHPQTDGNTERVHRTIEQILRAFVHNCPEEWIRDLSLAEFCYNNARHASTKLSPFEAIYGLQPLTPITLIEPPNTDSIDVVERIHDIHAMVEEELKLAKATQKHHADKVSTVSQIKENTYVLLDTSNLKLHNQPCKKFKARFVGPYKVIQQISSVVFKLELPPTLQIHPVFHVSKLKLYNSTNPELEDVDYIPAKADYPKDEHVFYVDKIVDHKMGPLPSRYPKGPTLQFKVRWDGYTKQHDTWEPYSSLKHLDELKKYVQFNPKYLAFITQPTFLEARQKYPSRFP